MLPKGGNDGGNDTPAESPKKAKVLCVSQPSPLIRDEREWQAETKKRDVSRESP